MNVLAEIRNRHFPNTTQRRHHLSQFARFQYEEIVISIRKIPGSNPLSDTDYLDSKHVVFFFVSAGKYCNSTYIGLFSFPFISIPIYPPLTDISMDTMKSLLQSR
jgi:hypothetical protein